MKDATKPFDPTSAEDWRNLIRKELKSLDYDDLCWTPANGLHLKPDYSSEDLPEPAVFIPGNGRPEGWLIREDVAETASADANKTGLKLLNNGVHALGFRGDFSSEDDLKALLKDIELPYISVHFEGTTRPRVLLESLGQHAKSKGYSPDSINGGMAFDPITVLLSRGNWILNEARDAEMVQELLNLRLETGLQRFTPLRVDASMYHHAGADTVTELAAALAHANEYLNWSREANIAPDDAAAGISFRLACGRSYYTQIAKLRALRPLWANVCKAYGANPQKAAQVQIACITSPRERSMRDPYTNMLRNTTQAMAAVIGGCNHLRVLPHDDQHNDFSLRIARNIQLLLAEEVHLREVTDPAAGSYMLERLTHDLMQQVWKRFNEIEAQGGLIEAAKNGWLQEQISLEAAEEERKVSEGILTYIGANKYPNPDEQGSVQAERNAESAITESKMVEPLKLRRAAQHVESMSQSTTA